MSPWKYEINFVFFIPIYTNQAQITTYSRFSKLPTYSDGQHHNSEYYH